MSKPVNEVTSISSLTLEPPAKKQKTEPEQKMDDVAQTVLTEVGALVQKKPNCSLSTRLINKAFTTRDLSLIDQLSKWGTQFDSEELSEELADHLYEERFEQDDFIFEVMKTLPKGFELKRVAKYLTCIDYPMIQWLYAKEVPLVELQAEDLKIDKERDVINWFFEKRVE